MVSGCKLLCVDLFEVNLVEKVPQKLDLVSREAGESLSWRFWHKIRDRAKSGDREVPRLMDTKRLSLYSKHKRKGLWRNNDGTCSKNH